MPKVRGYVDTSLIQKAIKLWPDLALVASTTGQIEFVFKKALELAGHNAKR